MILDLPVERWRRIEPILDQILDLPPAERDELLDTACDGDPDLRAEIEAFLAADEAAGGFLDTPAGEYAVDLLDEEAGTQEEDLPAGGQIGPYRLVREIGSGGMGVVYEAEDSRLRRRVAIKFLPPEYSRDRRAKERFLREARAASGLDHPNLCTVYDVGESDGRIYIVLAYYEGETLKERLRRGLLPVAEARDVAVQVARGLACAHEAGIIHRDIKPANVMLTRRGEAKILDFGVAKQGGEDISLTPTGGSWGTPAYMSPEQVRGEPADGRTDVWSLGVMLYEMLAGRRPFGGEGVQAVLSAILTREPEPIERLQPEVPPELAGVVERVLAKNPAERHGSAAELLADLETGSAPPLRVSRRLRRLVPAALLIGGVAIVVFLAWSFGWWPQRPAVGPPLRVAILKPVVTPASDDLELHFIASEVIDATLGALLSLEGLQPLDPPEQDEERGSGAERQRAAEADELLRPFLRYRNGWCELSFRRIRQPEGEVLDTVGPFPVQTGIENSQRLAQGVRVNLRPLYPDHPPRPDPPGQGVRAEDHAAYIQLERRVDQGEHLGLAEVEKLDALLQTSPGLVDAYLLAAGLAKNLGEKYFESALGYAAKAQELAPNDPRPLVIRLRIEVAGNRFDAAQETLARLVEIAPSDIRVKSAEADLLEARDELKKAYVLRQEVARMRPVWRPTLDLVTLEIRMGKYESARRHLGEILKAQPENNYARENLALLEGSYGDLKRAAALYEDLIAVRPTGPYWANLGFAYFLLRDYVAAESAYHRALELEPGYHLTRFNLAAALVAQGDLAGAQGLCRTLVRELEVSPTRIPVLGLLDAQCLVHLGRREDAINLANNVLEEQPEDFQALFRAAQFYALLGKPSSALHYTEKALERGLRREWFTTPEFRLLERNPEFRTLLDSARRKESESHSPLSQ